MLDLADQLGEEGKNNHELEKAKRCVEQEKLQLVVGSVAHISLRSTYPREQCSERWRADL